MSDKPSLDDLRQQIDAIDNQIHDLIMARTRVVEQVRDLKQGDVVKIRPAREDQIAYRLMERHQGHFPRRELIRIWRELIVATLGFEGPFSAAVYVGGEDSGNGAWDLARDQYGSFTPMMASGSFHQVIEAVRTQEATVGILPLPRQDDENPWWRHLVTDSTDAPRIIARLPFAGAGNSRGGGAEALVVCPVNREATDRDHAYLAIETEGEISPGRVRDAMAEAGFDILFFDSWADPHVSGLKLNLIEVDGFVPTDDPRIEQARDTLGSAANRIVRLGGYATPLSDTELNTAPD